MTVDTLFFIRCCCLKLLSYSKYIYFSLFYYIQNHYCWVVQVRCITIIKLNQLSFLSFILLLVSLFSSISFELFHIHHYSFLYIKYKSSGFFLVFFSILLFLIIFSCLKLNFIFNFYLRALTLTYFLLTKSDDLTIV